MHPYQSEAFFGTTNTGTDDTLSFTCSLISVVDIANVLYGIAANLSSTVVVLEAEEAGPWPIFIIAHVGCDNSTCRGRVHHHTTLAELVLFNAESIKLLCL